MPLSRRHFLKASAAIPLLGACATPVLKGSEREGFVHISAEELELIKNPLSRHSYFVQRGMNPETLEIRERVFTEEHRFDRQDLEEIKFIQCHFEGFIGFGNNLKKVVFEDCQFFGGTFTGDVWQDVRLIRCMAEGPFGIGASKGLIIFEDCDLRGATPKEIGYGHPTEHFGMAASFESTKFIKCRLSNISTKGSKLLSLVSCEISDLKANCHSKNGVLEIEGCVALSGKQDFNSGDSSFSKISIKDSQLNLVSMIGVSSYIVEVDNSSLSLRMASAHPGFRDVRINNTKFHTEGLGIFQSNIINLTIESSAFLSKSQGLQLNGELNDQPAPGESPVYWGTVRNLAIRNTVVPKAKLGYMQLGDLTLEKSTLADADLSHSTIGTLRFKEAKLDGALDLSNTTIRQVDNQGLSNTAQVTGRLESNPAGPPPDLSGLNKLQPGSNGKR